MSSNKLILQRETISFYWNKGIHSPNEIYRITGISLSTIKYNIRKLKETGNILHRRGNGRPKIAANESLRVLKRYIRQNNSQSLRSMATKLSQEDINMSYKTVGRRLEELGYKNGLPIGTPMLTATQKANRVEWAQNHLNDCWEKTLFSDETAFQLFRNTIKYWYKGSRPVRPLPKNRQKILAWGGFCIKGKTNLFCFTRIMDAKFYIEILEQHIPEVRRMLGRRWRFQQDNDPKHTSRLAKEFLQENVPEVIDWPSNSPDLNPIENLWSIVKHNIEKRLPQNIDELKQFMIEEWEKIPESFLVNLVQSMKKRCQLVIERNGERIPY